MKKKIINIIIYIFVLLIMVSNIVYASNKELLGDINQDNKVDSADQLIIMRHIMASARKTHSEWILSGDKLKLADVTQNNIVDNSDMLKILRYIAAKSNPEKIGNKHKEWLEISEIDLDTNKSNMPAITNIEVNSIKLNKTTMSLDISGTKTATIKPTITPSTSTNKSVTYSSSNTKVATVDKNGKITAKGNGTATITVKTSNGKKATSKVTVTTSPTSVKLNKTKLSLDTSGTKTATIKPTITPSTSTNKSVTYSSSNTKVATVDKNGKITAKKNGSITITVKTSNKKSATCKVTVTTSPTSIMLKNSNEKIDLSQSKTITLVATIKPTTTTNKKTIWSSSDKSIATVDNKGRVTAKKDGRVKITAKTVNGKKATCTVTVIPRVSSSIQPVVVNRDGYKKTISLAGNKYKLYGQGGASYSGMHYHSYNSNLCRGCTGARISNCGCCPTAVATILSGYGFNLNPGQVGSKLIDYSISISNKNTSGYISREGMIKKLGMNVKSHVYNENDEQVKKDLKEALSKNHQIVYYIGEPRINRKHFICLLGIDQSNDKVFIGDAGSSRWESLDYVVGIRGHSGGQWDGWSEIYKE